VKTASAKAKGRRLQQRVAEIIRSALSLPESDVKSIPMGSQGADIWLSGEALDKFPFAVECKAQEKINIWGAFEQADTHAEKIGGYPIVVFSRNHDEVLCCLRLEDLLGLLK
jgi:hypothetical protein